MVHFTDRSQMFLFSYTYDRIAAKQDLRVTLTRMLIRSTSVPSDNHKCLKDSFFVEMFFVKKPMIIVSPFYATFYSKHNLKYNTYR